MKKSLTVLVTGTNRGMGYDLVSIFLKNHPQISIYATSQDLSAETLKPWQMSPSQVVKCKQLELTSHQSISGLAHDISSQLKKEGKKIDLIINNAGVCSHQDDGKNIPNLQYARLVMQINLLGPIRLTKELLPYLAEKGRVINVSSLRSALNFHPRQTQDMFNNPSIQQVDILNGVDDFLKAVEKKKMDDWYLEAYGTSKMLLNSWSRWILRRYLLEGQMGVCVTPGFCATPMTSKMPVSNVGQVRYSCYSGAYRIYQTALKEELSSDYFYHRARKTNYSTCGEELPLDEQPIG